MQYVCCLLIWLIVLILTSHFITFTYNFKFCHIIHTIHIWYLGCFESLTLLWTLCGEEVDWVLSWLDGRWLHLRLGDLLDFIWKHVSWEGNAMQWVTWIIDRQWNNSRVAIIDQYLSSSRSHQNNVSEYCLLWMIFTPSYKPEILIWNELKIFKYNSY